MENLLSAIEAVRQKFGATMSDDECALLCNEVAWKHRSTGWGLSGKTSGTRGHLPNGTEITTTFCIINPRIRLLTFSSVQEHRQPPRGMCLGHRQISRITRG